MKTFGHNQESLDRHSITAAMIDEVLASSMVSYFLLDDEDGDTYDCLWATHSQRS